MGDRRLPVMGLRDSLVGGVAAALLMVLIWAGSLALTTFDSALIGYAVAVVALTFAIVARYSRWLRMPSTRRYWRRGWQLFASWGNFRKLPGLFPRAVFSQLLGQGFIRRRGVVRWIGHQCLFWGVIGATLITFPLAFGWLVFHLEPGTAATYRMFVFGVPTIAFDTTSFLGWSIFRGLAYAAVLVIVGCAIFLWRRFRDRAVTAGQRLDNDMVPLLALLVISVTGLLLTASATFLGRRLLRLPGDHPRGRRGPVAGVHPVRQVLPRRPAPGVGGHPDVHRTQRRRGGATVCPLR